jgi:secondary thiamine-phosphate synthase enzyme
MGAATLELVRQRGEVDEATLSALAELLMAPAQRAEPDSGSTPTDPEDTAMTATNIISGEVMVATERIHFTSAGNADIINITADVRRLAQETALRAGTVTIFVPGATGALTTLEYEPGVVQDFQHLFDRIAPAVYDDYEHNRTNVDGNGHAHVRAGLLGPSLVVPIEDGVPLLGRWQEICFVCFDNRPRERTVIVQFLGVK